MSKSPLTVLLALALAACAQSSGRPAAGIAQGAIAAAYLPLQARVHLGLDSAEGAAVVIAPGIAATNGHNRNLLDPAAILGEARDYDLLFFRKPGGIAPAAAEPRIGEAVTAYGQGTKGELRQANGTVREISSCPGCTAPAWFTFANAARGANDAGPGFSGGPVVNASGQMIGIVFGYKDETGQRLIYAYDMARIRAELALLQQPAQAPR